MNLNMNSYQTPGGFPREAPASTGCLWRTLHIRGVALGGAPPPSHGCHEPLLALGGAEREQSWEREQKSAGKRERTEAEREQSWGRASSARATSEERSQVRAPGSEERRHDISHNHRGAGGAARHAVARGNCGCREGRCQTCRKSLYTSRHREPRITSTAARYARSRVAGRAVAQ